MSLESHHFQNAQDAAHFLKQCGFRFFEAPGRWWKALDGKFVRAEMHLSAHGALVVISQ